MNEHFAHILLVEDDDSLASLVSDYLSQQGFKVSIESRGDTAVESATTLAVDLVLLDIMLPGLNGLEVCRSLRSTSSIPVIILTAQSDEIDQIVGLEVGADDYVCKPVQPRLLLARINSLLRRTSNEGYSKSSSVSSNNEIIRVGSLSINYSKQEVLLANESVGLTSNEITLLHFFASHPDTILSRDELMNQLRGFEYDGMDRTVDMLVSRLRRKLEITVASPKRIKTVWKKGYLFVSDAW